MGFLFSREEEVLTENTFLIVTGLTSSGKTHFLDAFHFGSDTTKLPTIGFYETQYENFTLREIGGSMDWKSMIRSFKYIDGLIHIVNVSGTDESIMQSRNLLLGVYQTLPPNTSVVVLLNKKEDYINERATELLQLKYFGHFVRVLACELNFENPNWQEKISKVLKWIIK